MKLADLLAPWHLGYCPEYTIKGNLCNDSRAVQPHDVFLAYPGSASDGRRFIKQALEAGSDFIIYEPENWPENLSLPNPNQSIALKHLANNLASLASRFYHNPTEKVNVIGITGTNGKTTIAYQLAQAHNALSNGASYIGTLGHGQPFALQPLANTTPDALFLQRIFNDCLHADIKQVCMEVSSHALEQQRVDGVHFKQAIFTNLTLDHLDYHHTMDAYAAAKAKLFAWPSLEYAIINQDDPYAALMQAVLPKHCQLLTYGLQSACDVKATSWQVGMTGTQLEVDSPWGHYQFQIQALGFFNIYNTLAIFTSLLASGYPANQVIEVMQNLQAAPGRMEIVAKKPCVIVDYAHTPDALANVLSTLNKVKENRLITVFGCGGDRDKSKRPIMGKIASEQSDIAIMTSDNPRTEDPLQIIQDIAQGINHTDKLYQLVEREEAIAKAIALAEPNDIVLIAGKGHEAYQQIGQTRYPFSDQDIAKRYLAK